MRCPRCGDTLESADGELTCRRGGMGMSWVVRRELETWIADGTVPKPRPSLGWGVWHCPVDGTRMHEADGQVRCPQCGRCLPHKVIYLLIEFHTHRPVEQTDETSR